MIRVKKEKWSLIFTSLKFDWFMTKLWNYPFYKSILIKSVKFRYQKTIFQVSHFWIKVFENWIAFAFLVSIRSCWEQSKYCVLLNTILSFPLLWNHWTQGYGKQNWTHLHKYFHIHICLSFCRRRCHWEQSRHFLVYLTFSKLLSYIKRYFVVYCKSYDHILKIMWNYLKIL